MKKIKKMPLVIFIIIVLVLITGTAIFFLNTRETKEEKKLDPKTVEKVKKDEKKDEENKEETEKIEEQPKAETTKEPQTESNSAPASNNSSKSNTSSSNSQSSTNNYVAPSSPPAQQEQPKAPAPAPTCTPKKFYTTFRADFTSEAECESTYNYYHNIDPDKYLGFICSYQTDDCGDMYYMLTFFDSNGNYFGYNEI